MRNAKEVPLYDISSPEILADLLGEAKAELAEARDKAKFLEELTLQALQQAGLPSAEGSEFRIALVEGNRTVTNWRKIAERLGPSPQLVAGNTRRVPYQYVRVSARKGEEA